MEKDPPIPMTNGSFKEPVKIYEVNTNLWISTFRKITQNLSSVLPKIQNSFSGDYFLKIRFRSENKSSGSESSYIVVKTHPFTTYHQY